MKKNIEKIKYMIAFTIYGTVGIVSHYIGWSNATGLLVFFRALIGIATIAVYLLIRREPVDWHAVKKNLPWLALAGLALGGNWICLFTSYNFTSVAIGTLCNYLAPSIVILLSPLLFHERLSVKKLICVMIALFGLVCISGVFTTKITGISDFYGILLGLGSAACYVGIVTFNKKLHDIKPMDKTIMELVFALCIMAPYAAFTTDFTSIVINARVIILIAVIGIVHTGVAYVLYFGSMEYLEAQTIAVLSYIEPILSVALSYFLLKEEMTVFTLIGAIAIIGATFTSDVEFKKLFHKTKELPEENTKTDDAEETPSAGENE